MKKAIASLLVLVMVLSLCGCRKLEEQYEPLVDALDAGNYDAVKGALMELSSDFATEQEQMVAGEELLEKYADVIDALENEDYDSAVVGVESRRPIPPEPEYTAVEITMDNWQDYFELKVVENWEKNDFGEVDTLVLSSGLALRDEYRENALGDGKTEITYEMAFDFGERSIEIDFENQTYEFTSGMRWKEPQTEVLSIKNFDEISFHNYWIDHNSYNSYHAAFVGDNLELLRIEGTLCLLDNG